MTATQDFTFRAALLTLAVLLPGAAEAQSYTIGQSSASFQSISTTGTPLTVSNLDDGYATVTLPFSFSFFGSSATSIYPSTNGMLAFGTSSTDYGTTTIPTSAAPNSFVAPFWRDMIFSSAGMYSSMSGSSGSRVFTIEWNNLAVYSSGATSNVITFQVRLHEGTNIIDVVYGSSVGSATGAGVGIEDSTGTRGVALPCTPSCGFTDVPQGTLVTFTPAAGGSNADLTIAFSDSVPTTGNSGDFVSGTAEIDNGGDLMSTSTTLGFYIDTTTPDPSRSQNIGSASVPAVAAFGSTNVSWSFTLPSLSSGSYVVAAFVNPSQFASESDYSNNSYALGRITIGGGGNTITVLSNSLPHARSGTAYSTQLQQSGATSPSWSVSSGSLPSGLFLSSSGIISGTPSITGTYNFSVQCAQSGYTPGTANLELVVDSGGGGGLAIQTTMLPQATVGGALSGVSIQATGGTPPYAFQVVSGAPSWMHIASDGSVTGTPDVAGHSDVHISVFDSASNFVEGVISIEVVQGGPLMISTTELVAGVVGAPYSASVQAQGGFSPYQFNLSSGSLPDGLSLSSEGQITGTPTSMGMAQFQVQVTDAQNNHQSASLSINVIQRMALMITVPSTISLRYNQAAQVQLTASGGVPPYTWTLAGVLPAGVTLDGDTLRGTPTSTKATAHVSFHLSDSEGTTADKAVTVEVSKASNQTPGRGGGSSRGGGCTCVMPGAEDSDLPLAILAISFLILRSMARTRRSERWRAFMILERPGAPRSSVP
ncbi:MAG: putative Ig domain-containing protein [Myxococcota bacterium]